VDFPATSLDSEAGRSVDRLRLLRAILERLEAYYPLLAQGAMQLHGQWAARLAWLGESVVVHSPGGDFAGRAEAVDVDGALVIRLDSGATVRVVAGDVRLRLAAKV
jgi:biotin-(acetyl-CoA carboxylase) ligase